MKPPLTDEARIQAERNRIEQECNVAKLFERFLEDMFWVALTLGGGLALVGLALKLLIR